MKFAFILGCWGTCFSCLAYYPGTDAGTLLYFCDKNKNDAGKVYYSIYVNHITPTGIVSLPGLVSSDKELTSNECVRLVTKNNVKSNSLMFYCDKNTTDKGKAYYSVYVNHVTPTGIVQAGLVTSDIQLTGSECVELVMKKNVNAK